MQIICTIGPESASPEALSMLRQAGMDIARFNFSHANYAKINHLMDYSRRYLPDLEIMQDLQGVKLRVAQAFGRTLKVREGDGIAFCSEDSYETLAGSVTHDLLLPVHFEGDFSALDSATVMFMKDATMQFDIVDRIRIGTHTIIRCIVARGGVIRPRKALNAPGMDRSSLPLTKKDRRDIDWGLKRSFDIVCLSFVCEVNQVKELRAYIKSRIGTQGNQAKMPRIWVKIETREGVKNFDAIRKNVDGIILARGDLGPEIGIVEVPEVQANLLKKMKRSPKPFFVATQVLSSLLRNRTPTRSELNDIYRCIKEKVSGFMLGEETGISRNLVEPVRVLRTMQERYASE
jgi:pyruvate kinase